jgi:hypothetical protein
MSWQRFYSNRTIGPYSVAGWDRYLENPDASILEVCHACGEEIERYDRQEETRDDRNMWIGRIVFAVSLTVAVVMSVAWAMSLMR